MAHLPLVKHGIINGREYIHLSGVPVKCTKGSFNAVVKMIEIGIQFI